MLLIFVILFMDGKYWKEKLRLTLHLTSSSSVSWFCLTGFRRPYSVHVCMWIRCKSFSARNVVLVIVMFRHVLICLTFSVQMNLL